MNLLYRFYEFLLGEDTDVPFEDPEDLYEIPETKPQPRPVKLILITGNDAA